MRALVAFSGTSDHPLARLLKPGFRHVFCAVASNGLWIEIDQGRGAPSFRYMAEETFDLADLYRKQGHVVIETTQGNALTWPLGLRTCVGTVKAALCIKSAALTPWGLYRHLRGT